MDSPPDDFDASLSGEMRDRLEKLSALRQAGIEPYPPRFSRDHTAAQVRSRVEAEGEVERVTVAGRLLAKRASGGMTFAPLQDGSGQIQLVAQRDVVGEAAYAGFADLDRGDIVGASGPARKTRRGEPSVWLESFRLLAKSLRPLPEKWHGLKDVETRYRQRYVDLIVNAESREVFLKRSRIIAAVRRLLDADGFVEVETPILQDIPGGGHAKPFSTHYNALQQDFYLRIALELPLKRLIVGGLERVYEIGRNFRNEGIDRAHNPEFTTLECYQAFTDLSGMLELTERIVNAAAEAAGTEPEVEYEGQRILLRPPFQRRRMVDLVAEKTDRQLTGVALAEAYEQLVEPALVQPTFVTDYPVETSPLARRREDDPRFVERFELIIGGREYANAFTELTDPIDQRQRFEDQRVQKTAGFEDAHPFDEDYIRALEYGMPPSGGLGVGIDRLVMLLTGQAAIRDVILFPQLKKEG
ncbi:MAG: lysine--tRNA ligase [Candidatus Dormibacteraeota bacterium]|nr:lysine--tRNA ligase [Candidatus Dormibacteraeota bacterium]